MSTLNVTDLVVRYRTSRGDVEAVRGVDLRVEPGETVAIVGESGSGKSTTAHALVRLLARNGRVAGGRIEFDGEDLAQASDRALRAVRGRGIGLVPQDPTVSLDPVKRVGEQVAEVLRLHGLADRRTAALDAVEALRTAGIPEPELRAQQYPHELSGGMRQRVLIAIAIVAKPSLLIADEPTSALDVTVQRQILDHLDLLKRELGMSLLVITHDLGVAADRADRVIVMSQGRVVETGPTAEVLATPGHAYTRSLLAAAPSMHTDDVIAAPRPAAASSAVPVVVARDLVKDFRVRGARGRDSFRAVDGVGFTIGRGETFALVGESGSGKSTTARLVLRLDDVTTGSVEIGGTDVTNARGRELRQLRRRMQLVHQNPFSSLNPKLRVGDVIADPLAAFGIGDRRSRRARVSELLDVVALPADTIDRTPAELSGGQRQRVAIARALAIDPELVVLDEAVSALDVSVQHQILTLLADIQRERGVSYLFISHDLAVVRQIAHRVGVMERGRLVETGDVDRVFRAPESTTTRLLLDAIPGARAAAR